MKNIIIVILCLMGFQTFAADDAQTIIGRVNKKFASVNDYSADVFMAFDIPGVKIKSLNGKAFYKKPNKFRIRAKGIFFLPKQNMAQQMNAMLADTKSYTAVLSGYEKAGAVNCAVINIIPLTTDGELIIGKFWIDSLVHDDKAMRYIMDVMGDDKICLGSDYPFPLGEESPGKLIEHMPYSDHTKDWLLYKSALAWMGKV